MKRLFLLCCCLAAAVPFSARGESLERALRAVTDSVRATVGVAVVFGDGDTLAVNGGRCYPMLSVCKFHQALAVLDRLDRRGLPLTTRIPVRRSDLLSGTWSPLREACPGGGRFTGLSGWFTVAGGGRGIAEAACRRPGEDPDEADEQKRNAKELFQNVFLLADGLPQLLW